jgi:hypothetical protein
LIVIAIALVVTSWLSLVGAYLSPLTTPAWSAWFGQSMGGAYPAWTGFAVEAARSLIFISLTALAIGYKFNTEIRTFFNLRHWSWKTTLFRVLYIIVALIFGYTEVRRMTGPAPARLAAWASKHGIRSAGWKAERKPYLIYIPYSLINYIPVATTLIVIPFFAVALDRIDLKNDRKKLDEGLVRVCSGKPPANEVKRGIDGVFASYRATCASRCARYLDILAVLTLAIQFETLIGKSTLTPEGYYMMELAWFVVGAAGIWFIVVCFLYQGGYEFTQGVRANSDVADPTWSNANAVMEFMKSVVSSSVSGVIVLTLLLPILRHFL